MGVFFFGMGFSSLATARAIHQIIDGEIPIFGTSRNEEGIEALAESPYRLHLFDGAAPGMTLPPDVPFAEADMTPMARSFYSDNKRVSNKAICEALGIDLLYPSYREGLAAIGKVPA